MAGREKRRTESMKTISGKLTSAPTPLSLSKATRVISAFVAADSTASQPLYAYLKRAAAAFTELNQLHRELKSSSSSTSRHGRRKKSQSQLKLEEGDSKGEVVLNGGEIESVDKKRDDLIENKTIEEEEEVKEVDKQKEEVGNGEKSKKKAKTIAGDEVVIKEVEEVAKEIVCGKKRKKKVKVSTEEEEVKKEEFLSEETGKKKKAQAVKEAEEVRIEENEAKKEEETGKEVEAEEKRKSIKVEKELNDSEEMPKSKKKRRKME